MMARCETATDEFSERARDATCLLDVSRLAFLRQTITDLECNDTIAFKDRMKNPLHRGILRVTRGMAYERMRRKGAGRQP